MEPYTRKVQYYETDRMGVMHHSNYIRWMEEARIDFMDRIGFPYVRMEAEGVVSPVRALSCEYRKTCTFGDTLSVSVTAESFDGLKLVLRYEMRNERGEKVFTARSEHAFLNREGRIVRMDREMPAFRAALEAAGGQS